MFAILTSIRKSRSIRSIEKLMISLNQLDTHDSIISLCGFVKEATRLWSLCTFFTGVVVQWPGGGPVSGRDEKEPGLANTIYALSEKKN